ncbi:MAG: o-succinylbenzoate synthase [Cyanobacteriota bacterium]|nr:o-succinylbenzoate synthase [Cyanobacteriota bacterium]
MAGPLRLEWRAFAFALPQPLHTARGVVATRRGWLLRLVAADGAVGWGEVAPWEGAGAGEHRRCAAALATLTGPLAPLELDRRLPGWPPPLAFGLGLALAELAGLGQPGDGWRPAPPSAWLLPAGPAMLPALERAVAAWAGAGPFTLKWKVAAGDDAAERALFDQLLERLPATARLRLDANAGWDRTTAAAWADRLAGEPRLEWLEQPLAAADLDGLTALAARLPLALDESLQADPPLRDRWPGWQVRRPALEGDPRPLLAALAAGRPRWMVSTALESGVGRRLVEHAAALQWAGPTPTAPGLAPGWRPGGPLFGMDPEAAWHSLRPAP